MRAAVARRWPGRASSAWWCPASRTSSSTTSRRPRSTTASTTRAGSTLFGRLSSMLISQELAELAAATRARPARPGRLPVRPDERRVARRPAVRRGAAAGQRSSSPPAPVRRFERAPFSLAGRRRRASTARGPGVRASSSARCGAAGATVDERPRPGILWTVDANGRYAALWEIPRWAPCGALPDPGTRQALPACVAHASGWAAADALAPPSVRRGAGGRGAWLSGGRAGPGLDRPAEPASGGGGAFPRWRPYGRGEARGARVFAVRGPAGAAVSVARAAAATATATVAGGARLRG